MILDLTEDEALVLFEWLTRREESDDLPFEDPAEERALWSFHAQLEKLLVQPFHENYRELLTGARARIRGDQP